MPRKPKALAQPPLMAAVRGPRSYQADYLEGLRAKRGWTYLRIAQEIEESWGYSRTEEAVRQLCQGKIRGRQERRGQPPLIVLVTKALGGSIQQASRYQAMDIAEELNLQAESLLRAAPRARKGYSPQTADTLGVWESRLAAPRSHGQFPALVAG